MFTIEFISHVKDGEFIELTIGGIEVLMGPTVSISHSTAINSEGRKEEYRKTYAYMLRATKGGEFQISEAGGDIAGKKYFSKPHQIKDEAKKDLDRAQERGCGA